MTTVALSIMSALSQERLDWAFSYQVPLNDGGPSRFTTVLDLRSTTGLMHSPHIATGEPVRILWFQGSEEAVADVEIWHADVDPDIAQTSQTRELFDARAIGQTTSPAQPVLVLGNTIQTAPGNQSSYISTVLSVGGWAAASIAHVHTVADVPIKTRKLPLSPFLNRSILVRNGSVEFADHDIAIPAYHEMAGAFGLIVRLGADGRVKSTARIGHGKTVIQPEIVVTGPLTAVAFLRPFNGASQLYRAETIDGGLTWSAPALVADVGNPDSPVAALLLSDGRLLMAANDDPISDRVLSLLISSDQGRSWKTITMLEDFGRKKRSAVRYPDIARLDNGQILLTYSTYSKTGIRAHIFNEAWLTTHE